MKHEHETRFHVNVYHLRIGTISCFPVYLNFLCFPHLSSVLISH